MTAGSNLRTPPLTRNVDVLGQVFTPAHIVEVMVALKRNSGRTLEPSCGNGAFLGSLSGDVVAVEVDPRFAPPDCRNIDFFDLPLSETFDTIIGNPPYVRYRDIPNNAKRLHESQWLDQRSNLYLFFIEKCVRHLKPGGELIFITPRDLIKSTSSIRLNTWLLAQGGFTDWLDLGDTRLFKKATPNCVIWRYQLGYQSQRIRFAVTGRQNNSFTRVSPLRWQDRFCHIANGHLHFSDESTPLTLVDIADIRVGAVSGADKLFANATHANRNFVCSHTITTGQTRHMAWTHYDATPPDFLLPHKAQLIARKVSRFNENNWWRWGRSHAVRNDKRIYVNCKTRRDNPFFTHPCKDYDSSILAIFPHNPLIDIQALAAELNRVDWQKLGFVCDGRYLFSQRSLQAAPLSDHFTCYRQSPATF